MARKRSSTCSSRFLHAAIGAVVLLLTMSSTSSAQDLGTIVGTVTDPSGAVIPGVKITVTNEASAVVVRSTETNNDGNYAAPDLPASDYSVSTEKQGFKTAKASQIHLSAKGAVRVDLKLTLGDVAQEVSVTATVVNLQTETGAVSHAITGTEVESIDTDGRSVIQLASLIPGAASQLPSFNVPVGPTSSTAISFNGLRESDNVWSYDGIENYDRGCGGCITTVPDQESLQEFKVETSNAVVSTGFSTAGQVRMVTKSGTSKFHGEAFEVNRNTAMAASSFFANESGSPKPSLIMNDFGFNVGGPITLPHHAPKTFFFFEADWRRVVQGATIVAPAPPAAWTKGDFSSYSSPILDHSEPVTLPDGTTGYQPFSNNQIPAGDINSNAAILAAPNFIFPSPNTPGGKFYGATPSERIRVDEDIIRVDHQFSDKLSLMARLVRDATGTQFPTSLWSSDTYPTVGTLLNEPTQNHVAKLTYAISSNLLNEFSFGYQRNRNEITPTGTYARPSDLTTELLYPGSNLDNRMPSLFLHGPALGTGYDAYSWPWVNVINTWSFLDSVSKVTGNHQLKFGVDYIHYLKAQQLFGYTQGSFTFNGSATAGRYLAPNGQVMTTTGNEFADFMLGQSYSFVETKQLTYPTYINNLLGLYVGDSWKVLPHFTLDYGVRWEYMPHVVVRDNQVASFRPSLYVAADAPELNPNGSLVPGTGNVLNGMAIAGQNGIPRGLVQTYYNLFEPRIGFAWQPWGHTKTVIRGGAGIFHENIQGNDVYNVAPNPPFSSNTAIYNANLTTPGGTLGTAFPGNTQNFDPRYLSPTSQQWSLGIEQEISPKVILSVAYVGNKGSHLQENRDINQPLAPAGTANIDTVRPYLGWGDIDWYENSTSSNYNSLQVGLRTAEWHGMTSGLAYTWAHCFNYADGDVPGEINNAYNLGSEYASCGYDIRNDLLIHYAYSLPFFKGATGAKRSVLGGWQASGITTFSSGLPFTVGYPGDPAEVGAGGYRADLIGNPNAGAGIHTAALWFNTAAFAPIPIGQFGNGGRNTVRGQGINNWDFSIFKNFANIPLPGSKEGGTIQLRFESFNLFNHTQFNGYFLTYGQAGFGAPNSTRDPRSMQIGAKFMF